LGFRSQDGLTDRFELIASPALLAELTGVLERPKFRRWLPVEEARTFVQTPRASATLIDDPPRQHRSLGDPDDTYLVTLARKAKADCLISGNADLTSLSNPRPSGHQARRLLASLDTDE
jgi:uncharacterized protein